MECVRPALHAKKAWHPMKTCLHCGAKLSPLNRNLLLCRRCAQADEQQIDNYFGESEAQTPLIYLSYRWSDAGALSDLIYQRLVERFGHAAVVRDIDRLALGVPLPRLVDRMMRRAVAVLIVIGPDWLASQDATGQPRLDDPDDLVRREVDTALRLSRYFGMSDRFWMNLQTRYDLESEKDRLNMRSTHRFPVSISVPR